jgi:glycosyltransferase involved in cell wall biosynthesis
VNLVLEPEPPIQRTLSTMSHQYQSLRVAVVASSLNLAGAEKQTFYMARALLNAGIEVQFFYLGEGGHYETLLRQAGVPVRQIYTPNRPWSMLARLTGDLCRWRPQIVLAAQFGDLRYAAAAGRLCQALVLGGIRSDGFYELNTYGRFSWWLIRCAHGLVVNSRCATQNLVFRGVKPQKIEVLSNVIDLQDFDGQSVLPPDVPLPPGRMVAATVGSLQPCKRLDRFLEALALARRGEPALAGVIAGSDRGVKAELQARANALGLLPDHVAFLGEVNRVPALLARSALLVLTSAYEGFPNVILEAMAARLPVISVPAGDAASVVEHGKTGYVVEADDTRSLAAFMTQLAQTPALRKRLGEAGRKRVEQEYSYESLADRLMEVFQRFACQHRRQSLCELLERGVSARRPETLSGPLMLERPAV